MAPTSPWFRYDFWLVVVSLTSAILASPFPPIPESGQPTSTPTTALVGDVQSTSLVAAAPCRSCTKKDENDDLESVPFLPSSGSASHLDDRSSLSQIEFDEDESPSPTADDEATNVKRALPTQTVFTYDKRMDVLRLVSPPGTDLVDGKGFAIRLRTDQQWAKPLKIPLHYKLVAGFIKANPPTVTREEDECGEFVKHTQRLTYEGIVFDIEQSGKKMAFKDRGEVAPFWHGRFDDVKFLGPIKEDATHNRIYQYAQDVLTDLNKKDYNKITNNCKDFVTALYKKINLNEKGN